MHLFTFDKQSYKVHISEEVLLLKPFKQVYNKDKSKSKDNAIAEFAFIWFFADITSPYQSIIDLDARTEEIIKDSELGSKWKPDKIVKDAIEFYKQRDKTVVQNLYNSAMVAVDAINTTFNKSKELIAEADDEIAAVEKVIRALEKFPKVMQSLREAEKELIREIEDKEGKKKGSKQFGLYEDGLIID